MAEIADYRALLSGASWYRDGVSNQPVFLTYSFDATAQSYLKARDPVGASTFQPLSEGEKAVVRAALDAWASISGIRFFETTRHQGDLTFGFFDFARMSPASDAAGYAYFPQAVAVQSGGTVRPYSGESLDGGDVYFDAGYRQSPQFAGDFMHLALHEIGHALGLKHPFEASDANPDVLTKASDNGTNTVMSYDQAVRSSRLGPFDVAAIQSIYGGPAADGTHVASWGWDQANERLTQNGTAAAEILRGTGADDVIRSMGGADAISTLQGRDYIILAGQAAEVNGGSGIDTVNTGLASFNRAALSGSDDLRHLTLAGGGGQTFINVERLVFGAETIAFDVGGPAGQIYRIYQAAFDRTPDKAGLSFNLANYENKGFTLKDMANFFIVSPEFTKLYGANATDTAFVTAMYANVLDRAPDASGLSYYLERLGSGVWDRAHVLAGFSESPENISLVGTSIANGISLDTAILLA